MTNPPRAVQDVSTPEVDAETRIRDLMEITHSLSAIFAQENELLETQRPREIAPLQVEKARLAAAYAQSIRDVAQNRVNVQSADQQLLTELREITQGFEARASRQRALLEGAQKAGEGVIKAIADEAAAATTPDHYGKNVKQTSAPISVNENA